VKHPITKQNLAALLVMTSCLAAPNAMAQDNVVTLQEALKASKVLANFRLRYEGADFDNSTNSADALTYRARIGLETGEFMSTKFLIEFDHIDDLAGNFNDTVNGNTAYAVIADPNATELNRLQLTNTALPESFKGLTLDASYVDQINRIFGDDSPAGRFDSNSWFLNAGYKLPVEGMDVKLSGFAYLLDLSNAGLSSDTIGAKVTAKKGPWAFAASYASQSDAGDNPTDYTADYYLAEASYKSNGFTAAAGYEVLGADDKSNGRFTTPLATLHKFNGFADVFLGTPTVGLEDLYIKGGYKTGPVGSLPFINMFAVYHDFDSNEGGVDLGSEIDAVIATKIAKKLGVLFKYANYSQGDASTPFDRSRYSIQFDYSF